MLIETTNLTKQYGLTTALKDCSVGVEQGEVFGLLGPNGSGKTTLLRLLMGFLKPTQGQAQVDGLHCYHDSLKIRSQIAYLPGDARLFRQMKGRDALRFFVDVRPGGDREKATKLADRLELDLSRRVAFMSTGMRQKLALAAVMSVETKIVILDEPTANLDPTVRATVLNLVKEAKASGKTVLFSSHVLSEVEEICDRIVILRKGQLVHTQAMSELHQQHAIRLQLNESVPTLPKELRATVRATTLSESDMLLETDSKLPPVLRWLATLDLEEVSIEPRGLRPTYDRFHPPEKPQL